eukprot:12412782-Karenia_brevis.AAC.1
MLKDCFARAGVSNLRSEERYGRLTRQSIGMNGRFPSSSSIACQCFLSDTISDYEHAKRMFFRNKVSVPDTPRYHSAYHGFIGEQRRYYSFQQVNL